MINATLFLLDLDLINEGFNCSSLSATIVSLTSTVTFTIFGLDLLPHWSIATIFNCSSIGLNLGIENLPFFTAIVSPSTWTNNFLDLSITLPLIS